MKKNEVKIPSPLKIDGEMEKTSKKLPKNLEKNGKDCKRERLIMIIFGIVVGGINGLFGGGGGMLVVPILIYLLKRPVKTAHATAILIILPVTLCSAIIYLIFGDFSLFNTVSVGIGVVIGGFVGAKLLGKLSPKLIGYIFSALMLVAGVRSLFF